MRFGALPASSIPGRDAGPNFSPQDPIAEPIESQRKLFPRPTNMPRVLEGMRHRLRQVFRRDASRRAAGPTFHRSYSPGRADSFGFRRNSPDSEQGIRRDGDGGRPQNASTRPVVYRRPLPLSDLNGERIPREDGHAASSSLVKLGIPETPRHRADRSDGLLTTTGNYTRLVAPRQAGPSANRPPLMTVPFDDEPLETWPHSPSTVLNRD